MRLITLHIPAHQLRRGDFLVRVDGARVRRQPVARVFTNPSDAVIIDGARGFWLAAARTAPVTIRRLVPQGH